MSDEELTPAGGPVQAVGRARPVVRVLRTPEEVREAARRAEAHEQRIVKAVTSRTERYHELAEARDAVVHPLHAAGGGS
ncbi:MAG: hypothetical protein ACYDH5_01645 [Acidimicrobiales bacterium]